MKPTVPTMRKRLNRLRGSDRSHENRIFVRWIEGAYDLTKELGRLRSMPRVHKTREVGRNMSRRPS